MALKEKKAELFARVVERTGDVEAGGEGAGGPAGAAGAAGAGGLSPAALTAAEIRELIEG